MCYRWRRLCRSRDSRNNLLARRAAIHFICIGRPVRQPARNIVRQVKKTVKCFFSFDSFVTLIGFVVNYISRLRVTNSSAFVVLCVRVLCSCECVRECTDVLCAYHKFNSTCWLKPRLSLHFSCRCHRRRRRHHRPLQIPPVFDVQIVFVQKPATTTVTRHHFFFFVFCVKLLHVSIRARDGRVCSIRSSQFVDRDGARAFIGYCCKTIQFIHDCSHP